MKIEVKLKTIRTPTSRMAMYMYGKATFKARWDQNSVVQYSIISYRLKKSFFVSSLCVIEVVYVTVLPFALVNVVCSAEVSPSVTAEKLINLTRVPWPTPTALAAIKSVTPKRSPKKSSLNPKKIGIV